MPEANDVVDRMLDLRIISKKELLTLVPYCDQHILRLEKKGKFPKRLDVGENRVGWRLVEVEAWLRSRPVRSYSALNEYTLAT